MLLVLISTVLAACAEDSGSHVSISDVRIVAPAVRGNASVAYFSVDNNSDDMVTVSGVSSPQFGTVEMHETTIEGGVSRMRRIESINIAARSQMDFSPGGKHLMLMQPATDVKSGSMIALRIQVDDGLLLVSAALQDRIPSN